MATVSNILAVKGSEVHTIPASATVLEATRLMNQHQIGALVVTDGERIMGMFTERDVLRRVVVDQRAAAEVRVAEVMTKEVICCSPDTPVEVASSIMRDRRVRHLPVRDKKDGHLLGLISISDLNAHHAGDQEWTIQYLQEYIYGRV